MAQRIDDAGPVTLDPSEPVVDIASLSIDELRMALTAVVEEVRELERQVRRLSCRLFCLLFCAASVTQAVGCATGGLPCGARTHTRMVC